MALQLYNSLTRRTEEFKPLEEGRVGIYVCGPTVYGHAHLGHAKSYVSFDVLVRYLRYLGYTVTYVQNITDVGHLTDDADAGEDKIAKAARRERKHPMALGRVLYPQLLRGHGHAQLRPAGHQSAGQRPHRRADRAGQDPPRQRLRLRGERLGVLRRLEVPGLRQTLGTQYRRDDGRRSRRNLHGEEKSRRLRPLEDGPSRTTSCSGPAPGAWAIPAGTSNARPCP